jgi:hypothetical protein
VTGPVNRWWSWRYRWITQTEARARLQQVTAGLSAPRVIEATADPAKVQIPRFSQWQQAADRILRKRTA